jgi:outer membrane protein TolC
LILLFPLMLLGSELRFLIEQAEKSDALEASQLQAKAASRQLRSAKAGHLPTLDLALSHHEAEDALIFEPQSSAALGFKWTLFDSFATRHRVAAARAEAEAAQLSYTDRRILTALEVVRLYYLIRSHDGAIAAQAAQLARLESERDRLAAFEAASLIGPGGSAAIDSAYESARYHLWQLRRDRLSSALRLKSLTGVMPQPGALDFVALKMPSGDLAPKPGADLQAQKRRVEAVAAEARAIAAGNRPRLSFENRYTFNRYEEVDLPGMGALEQPESQNRMSLTLSMRLYDFGATSQAAQGAAMQARAAQHALADARIKKENDQALSRFVLQSAQQQLKAAKRALKSAEQSHSKRQALFENGAIDEVRYLEALSALTEARSRLAAAEGEEQIARASYYYTHGHNPKEFIQ